MPALLLEAFFYFFSLFPKLEKAFGRWPLLTKSLALAVSGALPVYGLQVAAGTGWTRELTTLCFALLVVCCWPLLLPQKPWADIGLLVLLTGLIFSDYFLPLYPETASGLKLKALAKLLWMRVGIQTFAYVRKFSVPRMGFLPNGQEWGIGLLHFGLVLAMLVPMGWWTGALKWQLPNVETWQLPFLAAGYFCALMLFLAYGEEYLVRGVLQQSLAKWMGGRVLPLLVTSLCFGAIHLPFRGQFPNWRFALVAAVAGVFYGTAFWQANSLRAAMVTHALTVTAWTMLFARSI
ncbi:MAG: CPBP family intramembrane glutamic endopeptidase [Bryobacter sp.]|nr:CPBP family intramembrane glutamic endopeptidase [Bryobacter sp.]